MDTPPNTSNNSAPPGTPQQQIVEKLQRANNILVTVSSNPSVDQLAAAIGLTILLNKMKKHATAVFSGQVPSTIEFLKPEDTIEKNTDSLRDFIIALDKSKADKLRYKVEENIVKIFITPYRTSISENDLEFSQGDFNVDVVLALGVHEQKDLDQAITAHGRILHDAVVVSINVSSGSELGTINWTDPSASSLSELCTEITDSLARDLVDGQIATALLTGIVAETDRFSNEKTSPNTMKLSAELMSAGANQQLVASELQATAFAEDTEADVPPDQPPPPARASDDGTLEITHPTGEGEISPRTPPEPDAAGTPKPSAASIVKDVKQIGERAEAYPPTESNTADAGSAGGDAQQPQGRGIMTEAPSLGGVLNANTLPEEESEPPNVLGLPVEAPELPTLEHNKSSGPDTDSGTHAKAKPVAPPPEPDLPLPTPVASDDASLAPLSLPGESAGPSPVTGLGDFQPLDSEPPVAPAAPTPLVAPSAPLASTPPSTSTNQIHIDADGNLHVPDAPPATSPPPAGQGEDTETLSDIEQSVHSPHTAGGDAADSSQTPDVNSARDAVMDAINSVPPTAGSLPPKQDVGASGYLNVQDLPTSADSPAPASAPSPAYSPALQLAPTGIGNEPAPGADLSPADQPLDMPLPQGLNVPPPNPVPPTSAAADPAAPPPVPPPMTELPPFK
ncbi:MAG TPA: hypothetical protein VF261_02405 [Candidatus Saccharimonadales bacterium]